MVDFLFTFCAASYSNSTFDVIVTKHTQFDKTVLALILKLLKPSGKFAINSSVDNVTEVKENAVLSGFVNVQYEQDRKFDLSFDI